MPGERVKPVDRVTTGTFLLASPLLRDPNFDHTVVLMCEHGEGGSWGLVINRRTGLTFGELLDDLPFPASAAGPVLWGGPVETSRMQVLHRLRTGVPGGLEVLPGVQLGMEPDRFREVAAEERLPGEAVHAYVGHAGWGPGQLDAELESGSWIVCTGEARLVFETEPGRMWETALGALGPSFARLATVPPDPRWN
jgi:putative transcriptional regulator